MSGIAWAAWLEAIGTWVAAFATLCAVCVALFGPYLHDWWQRPRLTIEFGSTERRLWTMYRMNGHPAYIERMRVKNVGRSCAKVCEVRVLEILRETGESVRSFDAVSLSWVLWPHYPRAIDIAPNDHRDLDVIAICSADLAERRPHWHIAFRVPEIDPSTGQQRYDEGLQEFRFRTLRQPGFDPGTHVLKVAVVSQNAGRLDKRFRVEWDGTWSDDANELQRHFLVKEV